LNVSLVFLAIGASIFIGFAANFLFRKYGTPDVLVLILLGILFGPGALGVVDESLIGSIGSITPYVAGIALAIIMFEAGMDLNARQVLIASKVATLHTMLAFLLSMFATTAICMFVMSWPADVSLMLGAILGGTSGAIVIPLVSKLRISERTKIVLTLEFALTDVLVIVVGMSILFFITENTGDFGPAVRLLLSAFLISALIGLVSGVLWLRALSRLSGQPFSYMITLATLLTTYAFTEMVVGGGGGGAIAALVFGLVLGNKDSLVRRFGKGSSKFSFDEKIREFMPRYLSL
jgi:cell volume regulation protein A